MNIPYQVTLDQGIAIFTLVFYQQGDGLANGLAPNWFPCSWMKRLAASGSTIT